LYIFWQANTWIAIFSFIGNYWYTHYFYVVLGAKYTFPSWDVNGTGITIGRISMALYLSGVPIALFFATHFYFSFYHTLSNMVRSSLLERFVIMIS
jgi:cycloeucalenol cycloisomerase